MSPAEIEKFVQDNLATAPRLSPERAAQLAEMLRPIGGAA